ncbi:uncharacterized protein N7511_010004 [Penicillium nucicola]|uniref:uncharacterized protein n=1 Tax=Penicillium nucicola TaxID=1850975 RepID=UPI0025456411|nr:uncharacterized protein N7511_010004 [Penicillium nucicola]KAJ5748308.1 hypothetical protein N7511_010004 [Penicillium nucicola]
MNAKQPENSKQSTIRIRDNQRRSRTRRKEYLHDLEQRLRAFEKLGVTATQEVQAAGKKVATENALLRSLLMLHGVTEPQINQYLEVNGESPSSIPSESHLVLPSGLKGHLQTAPSQPLSAYHHSPIILPRNSVNNTSYEPGSIGSGYQESERNENSGVIDPENEQYHSGGASIHPATAEPENEPRQTDNRQETGQFTSPTQTVVMCDLSWGAILKGIAW